MKTHYILLLSFYIFSSVFAQESEVRKYTLAECEELAFENSPDIQDAEISLEKSRIKQSQASHARFLPKFELRNVVGPVPRARGIFTDTGVLISPDTSNTLSDLRYFFDLNFSFLQPLYTFGKLSGLNEAAVFGVRAEEAGLMKKKSDVRLKIRELYWGLVLGYELLNVVQDVRIEVMNAETKLNEKLDEGSEDVAQTDLFKLEIFKYEVNKRHREAVNKIEIAKLALRTSLGISRDEAFDISTEYLDPIEVSVDSLRLYQSMAQSARPEVEQLRAGLRATRALVGASKSDYYPQFFIAGGYNYNYAKDRYNVRNPFLSDKTNHSRPSLFLGMNLNLNFFQTRDKVRMAQADYNRLRRKEELLDDGIRLEVKKAYLELKQIQQDMRESKRALRASKNWLRSVSMSFDIGLVEIKEFIDAFRANAEMQAEYLQNIYKYNTAVAKLSHVTGKDLFTEQTE